MKLLITGEPKSGKSTTLGKLVGGITPRRGFITKEVVKGQHRTGFVVEDMNNRSVVLAQTEHPTGLQVGRFYVQPQVLAEFTQKLSSPKADEILYIDEVGQMQLYSDEFKRLVEEYLYAPNDFLATITSIYSDEFTRGILKRDDILLFQLTEANRDEIKQSLSTALNNRGIFNELPPALQVDIIRYANSYLTTVYTYHLVSCS
jgi:nucleoside-triphosphatase